MEFTFNPQSRENQIKNLANSVLEQIKNNLSEGKRVTEIVLPKEIAGEVKMKIEDEIEGQQFDWVVMYKGMNPYTGRTDNYTSQTIGDKKHYKLRYYGS